MSGKSLSESKTPWKSLGKLRYQNDQSYSFPNSDQVLLSGMDESNLDQQIEYLVVDPATGRYAVTSSEVEG